MNENLKIVYSTLKGARQTLPALDASTIDAAGIPRRCWLVKNRLLRKYVSAVIAPGGVGKTMLGTLECISVATGQPLTGYEVCEQGNALLFNAEDPRSEMEMRVSAVCDYYEIDKKLLHKKLYLISGRDFRCRLVTFNPEANAYETNHEVLETLRSFITEHNISLLYLDPFIRIHDVPENDNVAIDKVAELLSDLADSTGCSVSIAHHSRKHNGEGGAGDQDTSRGASSLISAARIAHTLTAMSEKEAKSYGLDSDRRNWYVRMDDAKVNLAPPANQITWFEKKSVTIANGESVGVLKRMELSKAEELTPIGMLENYIEEAGEPITMKEATDFYRTVIGDDRSERTIEAAIRRAIEDEKCQLVVLQKGVRNEQNHMVNGVGLQNLQSVAND